MLLFLDPYNDVNFDALKGNWKNKSRHIVLIKGVGTEKSSIGEAISSDRLVFYSRGTAINPLGASVKGYISEDLSSYKTESCNPYSQDGPPQCSTGNCIPVPKAPVRRVPITEVQPKLTDYDINQLHINGLYQNVNINNIFIK